MTTQQKHINLTDTITNITLYLPQTKFYWIHILYSY